MPNAYHAAQLRHPHLTVPNTKEKIMNTFETYVAPRIAQLESYLRTMPRRMSYSLEHDDFARVRRLSDLALEAQDRLVLLRALEGAPDSVVSWHLASF
jgi:phosphatidylserine/phosphatidylglycerophosphate/cardiolipin synthase-like enzyme